MFAFNAETIIDGSAARVWSFLTDAEALVSSDIGILTLDGRIALGESLVLRADVSPKQTFRLKVTEFKPHDTMVWRGGLPLGLFVGERRFRLSSVSQGQTRLTVREEFRGLMSGIIKGSMPDLTPSFERFVLGVKSKVEGISS